jgi:hypothetical protein
MARYVYNPRRGFLMKEGAYWNDRCRYTWTLAEAFDVDSDPEHYRKEGYDHPSEFVMHEWNERLVEAFEARVLEIQRETRASGHDAGIEQERP